MNWKPWIDELERQLGGRYWAADSLIQAGFSETWVYKSLGLWTLKQHIDREREVMKKNLAKFWYPIIARDKRCLKCGARNDLQVDHIILLARWGLTVWWNLQTLCGKCNREKWTRTIDHRPAWMQAKWPLQYWSIREIKTG
jgi:HNH endonuclease